MESKSVLALPLLGALFSSCVFFLLKYFLGTKQHPKEPPYIPQPIPYIGHLLGLIRYGTRYYAQVRYVQTCLLFYNLMLKDGTKSSQYPLEIYTLGMPHGNTYVVNSLDLVNTAQRNWKTLSFNPFVATFLKRLCLPSETGLEIIDKNLFAEDGPWGLFTDTHNAMHQALAPGPGLDELIKSMLQDVSELLNGLLDGRNEVVIDLYKWVDQIITSASTNAVYGPQNPFQDPEVRRGFW